MIGKTFGSLTILEKSNKRSSSGNIYWKCKCSCGEIVYKLKHHLQKVSTCKNCQKKKLSKLYTKHGKSNTLLYKVWFSMIRRCYNKKFKQYKNYGKRGIKVCDEWKNDFMSFFNWAIKNGWQKGLQIDRINNNEDYCPENCRFVTQQVNKQNKGEYLNNTSGYKNISFNGSSFVVTKTIKGKRRYIGSFKTIKEAVKERDKFCLM